MSAEQPEVCLRQKESYPQPHGVTEKPCAGILAAAFTVLLTKWGLELSSVWRHRCRSTGSAVPKDTPKNPWGGKLPCQLMEGFLL